MPSSGKTRSLQAKRAAARRWGHEAETLDRDYAAEKIADYIRRVVETAPPLTPEQCERIAAILQPATSGGAA